MKFILILMTISTFALAEPDWYTYRTDSCDSPSEQDDYRYRHTGLRRCRDGSVSFVQPPSVGAGGWEGRCGHTMAANMLYTICNKAVHPVNFFGPLLRDVTPGVKPATMSSGLNRAFFGQFEDICPDRREASWWYIKLGNHSNFLRRVKEYLRPVYSHRSQTRITRDGREYFRNPVGVLIQNPNSKILHWVMVIDEVERYGQCYFVVNHWDSQFEVPCNKLAEWSGKVGKTYPLILKSYQVVVMKD